MLNVLKHPEKEIAVSSPFPTYFDGGWNLKMWFLKCTNMLFSFDIPHNIYCVKNNNGIVGNRVSQCAKSLRIISVSP